MIDISTKEGFKVCLNGSIHELLAETTIMVCHVLTVISDNTKIPLEQLAKDMAGAITTTLSDDSQVELLKRLASDGETTTIELNIDAFRGTNET